MSLGQPDGIEDDSTDLPDPLKAAERVNAFLEQHGDGLVIGHPSDAQDYPPLYARDLQALANEAVEAQLAAEAKIRTYSAQHDQLLARLDHAAVEYDRLKAHLFARNDDALTREDTGSLCNCGAEDAAEVQPFHGVGCAAIS